jgi:predicted DNA-binding ribbon-helix-helix protein
MKSAIIKRSVVLDGHKTSVSLENEFWEGLREIADQQQANLSSLVRQIDRDRSTGNLSSAIRVFVYKHFRRDSAAAAPPSISGNRAPVAWPAQSAPTL